MRTSRSPRILLIPSVALALPIPATARWAHRARNDRPGLTRLMAEAKRQIATITVTEANALMGQHKTAFLDVRRDSEWAKGHGPGAMHMNRGTLEFMAERRLPHKATPIVIYCARGGRGTLATAAMMKMFYTNVKNMAGGLRA